MKISGMQKLTLLDYPGLTACLIFTQGCNFRCPFCHNSELLGLDSKEEISEEEVMEYLKKRQGLLDGVVISGGEPLLQPDIETFIKKIKDLGYKVKLDTNGLNTNKLKELIDKKLIDYIAMDIKNVFALYDKTAGVKNINIENIQKSIELIKSSNIDFEFRTTIVKGHHNIENIKKICEYIGKNVVYYIQNYKDCDTVLEKGLKGFSEEELKEFQRNINMVYPNVKVRGL